jgi:carboxypeptidase D
VGFLSVALAAGGSDAILVRIDFEDKQTALRQLHRLGIDVDGVFNDWARAYLRAEELDKLGRIGLEVTRLTPPPIYPGPDTLAPRLEGAGIPAAYHTYATLTAELQAIAADHPDLVRLTSVGQTVQGRELWMVQVSNNPDVPADEPEATYISSMHGDEVIGKELLIQLVHHLTDNYGTDSRITNLVDTTDLYFMPSMNPDGTELGQRWNANGTDLNRDFPDYYDDPVNTPAGRQPETQALMAWHATRSLSLAANMHGGALVANYPFDNNPTNSSVFSPAPDPDHDVFFSISHTYAANNPPMSNSNGGSFVNGVTNGADWYVAIGGRQDWAYVWYGTFEVTLELDDVKWPPASQLPGLWNDNLESMLSYLERVHEGVRGMVTDMETGAPVSATVQIDASPFPSYTDPEVGDYHRIVLPGSYTLQLSAPGYQSASVPVTVTAGPAARYDVALQPLPTDLQAVAFRVEDGPSGDGWLDPGETADLAVTAENLGRYAAAVGAQLEPTGWFADVMRAGSTYPDLATGQAAESDAPHFEVSVDPAVPAGHRMGFALRWTTADDAGSSEPFFVEVGAPSCSTVAATDLPRSIKDHRQTLSQLSFASTVAIAEVRVAVNILHTYIGDLEVGLTSPEGTRVVLHNQSGGSANDIVGTYGVDLAPAESLGILASETSNGTWQLDVTDSFNGDQGSLEAWSVDVCGRPAEAFTPEVRLRDLSPDPGGTLLRWWPYPDMSSHRIYRSTDPSSAAAFVDITAQDADPTDTEFLDAGTAPVLYYLVTGVGPQGEGPKGHFGQ